MKYFQVKHNTRDASNHRQYLPFLRKALPVLEVSGTLNWVELIIKHKYYF